MRTVTGARRQVTGSTIEAGRRAKLGQVTRLGVTGGPRITGRTGTGPRGVVTGSAIQAGARAQLSKVGLPNPTCRTGKAR